jgi:hypothetical protein
MGLGSMKLFIVNSRFTCIYEATSSNLFLLNKLGKCKQLCYKKSFFYNHMSLRLLLYIDLNKFWKKIWLSILNYNNKQYIC